MRHNYENNKRWVAKNPEAVKQYQREYNKKYREENKEDIREYQKHYRNLK